MFQEGECDLASAVNVHSSDAVLEGPEVTGSISRYNRAEGQMKRAAGRTPDTWNLLVEQINFTKSPDIPNLINNKRVTIENEAENI